ncbi:hypothetical protein KKC17_02055 [Patescibacteria group bacterium]|nr:hypothetical protein [Patescibacteria group bacterium]
MEILFGGHNYVFRPDGDEIIFMASEQRLPHTVVEKIKLPDNVTLLKTSTGATKLKSQNPFDIFTVVAASVQLI